MLNAPSPRPNTSPAAFEGLLEEAMTHHRSAVCTPDYALRSGVNVYGVLRYAAGACGEQERLEAQSDVARSPWALNVVTSIIKAARDPESKAALLLWEVKHNAVDQFVEDADSYLVSKIEEAIAA